MVLDFVYMKVMILYYFIVIFISECVNIEDVRVWEFVNGIIKV